MSAQREDIIEAISHDPDFDVIVVGVSAVIHMDPFDKIWIVFGITHRNLFK